MDTKQILSRITRQTITDDNDPRISALLAELMDDYRLEALEAEADAERAILRESEKVRNTFCLPTESIDFLYRLQCWLPEILASPAMLIGPNPPEPLELKYFPVSTAEPESSSAAVSNSAHLESAVLVSSLPTDNLDSACKEEDMDPPGPLLRSQSLQDEFNCCICLNLMYDPTSLTCGHSGCLECMKKVVKRKAECPICKTTISQSLVVTIALRNAIMRLFPDYGPPPSVIEPASQTIRRQQENSINLQETLDAVCRHYGLQYSDTDGVCLNVLSADGEVITSFNHNSFPFHRLLSDRRYMHPAYAPPCDRQAALVSQIRQHAPPHVDFGTCLLSDTVLYAVLPLRCTPLCRRHLWHQEWTEFQETFAAAVGEPLVPFASILSYDTLLPNRLLRKLCRRANGMFESLLAFAKIREVFKDFLTSVMRNTLLLHEQLHLPLVTCDHLLRAIPHVLPSCNDLQVYGYGVMGNIRLLLSGYLLNVLEQIFPATKMDEVALSIVHDLVVTVAVDVLHHACSYHVEEPEPVLYRRHSVPCSSVNERLASSGAPSGHILPWDFVFYDPCEDREEAYANIITARDILIAIGIHFQGDLAKHAKAEVLKAISKLKRYREEGGVFPIEAMESWRLTCGLEVCPAAVTLIVQSSPGLEDVRLSIDACVALACVTEYISAEILELSGNSARDMQSPTIFPRHVNLAVQFDTELVRLFPGIVRSGGVIRSSAHPQIPFLLTSFDFANAAIVDNYIDRIAAMGNVIAHPLCGRYMVPTDDSEGESDPRQFLFLPILDGLAYADSGEAIRQATSLRHAPTEVLDAVASVGKNAACTMKRRVEEIDREYHQSAMFPVFTHEIMVQLCAHILTEVTSQQLPLGSTPPFFTAEAIDLLSTLSEGYINRLLIDAYTVALHCDRLMLEAADIECARRIRGERP